MRISREQAFMQVAHIWARRSTCMRRNIGAVIVVGNRLVSTGYNGAPAGDPHCDGLTCIPPGERGCTRALHAEYNAICRLPEQFQDDTKAMFTTESPCLACASLIATCKITRVYYENEYRLDAGVKFLIRNKIAVFKMTPSGLLIRKDLSGDNTTLTEELLGGDLYGCTQWR